MQEQAAIVVPLAGGFEEIEAVIVIDVLRRAGLKVVVASLDGEGMSVVGAHGIELVADCDLGQIDSADVHALVLPGGMPGTRHLAADEGLVAMVRELSGAGRTVAAICAAPTVLVAAGVEAGRRMTSHPSCWEQLGRAQVERGAAVVTDGEFVTSQGAGTAMEFALALVERFVSAEAARELSVAMVVGGQA